MAARPVGELSRTRSHRCWFFPLSPTVQATLNISLSVQYTRFFGGTGKGLSACVLDEGFVGCLGLDFPVAQFSDTTPDLLQGHWLTLALDV